MLRLLGAVVAVVFVAVLLALALVHEQLGTMVTVAGLVAATVIALITELWLLGTDLVRNQLRHTLQQSIRQPTDTATRVAAIASNVRSFEDHPLRARDTAKLRDEVDRAMQTIDVIEQRVRSGRRRHLAS